VLERNFIIENVWADEGVLVGRSVDMFVSRLRKLLRDDPSIKLVAVHGVGYRMEVAP
jgi:DNA-binding response OmpR family regulator